jgi:hypothetical protein
VVVKAPLNLTNMAAKTPEVRLSPRRNALRDSGAVRIDDTAARPRGSS